MRSMIVPNQWGERRSIRGGIGEMIEIVCRRRA
jgi:hypothetical protein